MKFYHKLLIIAIVFITLSLHSNPIAIRFINEFMINQTDWIIEIHPGIFEFYEDIEMKHYYITSNTHCAHFKPDLKGNKFNYLIINQDSLAEEFYINPKGDILKLFYQDSSSLIDEFYFGKVEDDTLIYPTPTQSLSLDIDSYYLDNTPTIGMPNDTLNAMSRIKGKITDQYGSPIDSLWGFYSHTSSYDSPLFFDSLSNYSVRVLATKIWFSIAYEKNQWKSFSVQAYPESTIIKNLQIELNIDSVQPYTHTEIKQYYLSHNYPNPFNQSTLFSYILPNDDFVKVDIFDIQGRHVENLFSGFQKKGNYKLMWDSFASPSGIYVYQLKTDRVTLSKKCMVIK